MPIQKASDCVLKISAAGNPQNFLTIGGVRVNSFRLSNRIYNSSTLVSGEWRSLADRVGIKFLTISASGVFTGSAAEIILRQKAFAGQKAELKLEFSEGNSVQGEFIIEEYRYFAQQELEQNFDITLESAGTIELI